MNYVNNEKYYPVEPCENVHRSITADVGNIITGITEIESVVEAILSKIDGGQTGATNPRPDPACIADGLEYTKIKLERIYERLSQINCMV